MSDASRRRGRYRQPIPMHEGTRDLTACCSTWG